MGLEMEDYDELTPEADAPRSRAMSWLVLLVAISGFAGLAYYAYHSGTQGGQNGDMLIVQADQAPIKQAPADAGGEDFANKDKTIYDVITPNGAAAQNKVEKLLPDPEKPLAVAHDVHDVEETAGEDAPSAAITTTPTPAPAAAPATAAVPSSAATTFVNKNLTSGSVETTDAGANKSAPPPVATAETPVKKMEQNVTAPAVQTTQAAATTTSGPTFVNESPVATKKTPVASLAPAAKKPTTAAAKPAAKPVVKAAKGTAMVQLGAYKTEDEAKASWKKISSKFAGTFGGTPSIVKAELPNGTFYRLRTSTSDAKATCAKLTAQKQPCIPVK